MKMEEFRVAMLKEEIGLVNTRINHFDNLRWRTKQIAIFLWTATIGISLREQLTTTLSIAAVILIPFWLIDAAYRRYHVGWNERFFAIGEFIRDGQYKVKGEKEATLSDFLSSKPASIFPILDSWGNHTLLIPKLYLFC